MRIGGVPIVPVLVAAVAIYAIGFLIYAVLFDTLWMELSGTTQAEAEADMSRMAFSPVMPILTAVGLATVYRWAGVNSLARAVKVSVVLWLCFAFMVLLYGFTYASMRPEVLLMDAVHLLLNFVVGGLIIAAWPGRRGA